MQCVFPQFCWLRQLLAKHDPPSTILAYCYETQTEFHQIKPLKTNRFGDGEGCPPNLENFAYPGSSSSFVIILTSLRLRNLNMLKYEKTERNRFCSSCSLVVVQKWRYIEKQHNFEHNGHCFKHKRMIMKKNDIYITGPRNVYFQVLLESEDYFQCLVAPLHHFIRLLRLAICLSIMAASSKFLTDALK